MNTSITKYFPCLYIYSLSFHNFFQHPFSRFVYYTDQGTSKAQIKRVQFDGSEETTILSSSLTNPNSIASQNDGSLYVVDSKYNTRQGDSPQNGTLIKITTSGNNQEAVKQLHLVVRNRTKAMMNFR